MMYLTTNAVPLLPLEKTATKIFIPPPKKKETRKFA